MIEFDWEPTVLSNTGCQFRFFPVCMFRAPSGELPDLAKAEVLWDKIEDFRERHQTLMHDEAFTDYLASVALGSFAAQRWSAWSECSFLKVRWTSKRFTHHGEFEFLGVELAIETLSPGEDFQQCGFCYKEEVLQDDRRAHDAPFASIYQSVRDGAYYPSMGMAPLLFKLDDVIAVNIRVGFLQKTTASGPLGAHLVIDIGNTRTCALLLRDDPSGVLNQVDAIRSCCTPVMLDLPMRAEAVTRANLRDVDNGITSSWILLHQPDFDEATPSLLQGRYVTESVKRTPERWWSFRKASEELRNTRVEWRVPTMFVRNSPVLLGREAGQQLSLKTVATMIEEGLQIQQSSPKRYFAEQQHTQQDWSMVPNPWEDRSSTSASKLQADLLYWMSERGTFVDPDETAVQNRPLKAPPHPNYPRSATFIWLLVGILERAWDQCNRLKSAAGKFVPYELRNVMVTFPSGWTRDEVQLYRKRCEEAVRLFARSNFSKGTEIHLNMDVDEAVASQLPYVFSEIHKFNDNAQQWLALAGKCREGDEPGFRVMNLDIGGGTSDISVVEYTCLPSNDGRGDVDLQPTLLFRDGYASAGDDLARQILSQIIFPAIERVAAQEGAELKRYFTGAATSPELCTRRAKMLRLCLLPLVYSILGAIASGAPDGTITLERAGIEPALWDELYRYLYPAEDGVPGSWQQIVGVGGPGLSYDAQAVNRLIAAQFRRTFENVALIAARQDIDLFLMSGKTSELPILYEMAIETLPLTQERIIATRHYCAGDWYPFVKTDGYGRIIDNTIKDAKSITAVGAALNFLLANEMVYGWKIEKPRVVPAIESEWGFNEQFKRPNGQAFRFDAQGLVTVPIRPRLDLIARRFTKGANPSAVYCIQSRDPDAPAQNVSLRATLRRGRDEETQAEFLELVALTERTPQGERDCLQAFELAVCQQEGDFWQDTGRVID